MKLYMYVTADKYELPIYVTDTVKELAGLVGTTENSIYSAMRHAAVRGGGCRYVKVEVEDQ